MVDDDRQARKTVASQASRAIKTARAADMEAMTVISLLYNTPASAVPAAAHRPEYVFDGFALPVTNCPNGLSSSTSE